MGNRKAAKCGKKECTYYLQTVQNHCGVKRWLPKGECEDYETTYNSTSPLTPAYNSEDFVASIIFHLVFLCKQKIQFNAKRRKQNGMV